MKVNKVNVVVAIVLIILSIILYVGVSLFSQISDIKEAQQEKHKKTIAQIQELDAGISFQTKRQKLLLETRDIIIDVATRGKVEMNLEKAYKMAEANLYAAEKYKINPLLLLAIQTRENNFSTKRVSSAGARGHNQIWEPTGRILCRALDWEYSHEVLEDIYKSTELAAFFLQIQFISYEKYQNCTELVVAAYNGGPRNAEYYRIKSKRIATETAKYVPIVMRLYKNYVASLGMYVNYFDSEEVTIGS